MLFSRGSLVFKIMSKQTKRDCTGQNSNCLSLDDFSKVKKRKCLWKFCHPYALSQNKALHLSSQSQHSVSMLSLSALSHFIPSILCLRASSQGFVSGLCLRVLSQSIFLALRLSAYYQGSISAFYVSALLLLYFNFILHISVLYLDLCILDRIYLVASLFGSIFIWSSLLQIKLGNLT